MSEIRVEPIQHLREASRMGAGMQILHRNRAPYGWGVFRGYPSDDDFFERWFEKKEDALHFAEFLKQ